MRCGHDDQLCDSYQQFSPADFIAFCPIFRAELEAINDVPRLSSSFPAGDILATLLSPTVSSKHVLSLQLNTYRGYTFPRAHLLANILKGTALMDTSIHMSICQGLVLRLLLDCRDVPRGLRNSLAWSIKHFVSLFKFPRCFNYLPLPETDRSPSQRISFAPSIL